MPLRVFFLRALAILEDLGRGQIQRGHGGAAGRIAKLRITTEIADENDFIDATHSCSFAVSYQFPASSFQSPAPASSLQLPASSFQFLGSSFRLSAHRR